MFAKPVWKWINLAAFVCMLIVNVLAEVIPIAGNTTGEISTLYPSPLSPAPISFSIWGLIYLYLAAFLITQLVFISESDATEALGPWFLLSCIANVTWLFTWHARAMTPAMIAMAVLLITLILIESKLRSMRGTAYRQWLVRAPFGLYYGWITAATIANVSVWLSSIGFTGWGLPSQLWQTVVLLIGGVILCAGIWVNQDILYGLAGLWAYAGIMMRQLSLDMNGHSHFWSLTAIIISCVAMLVMILVTAFSCPVNKMPVISRFLKNRPANDPESGGIHHET